MIVISYALAVVVTFSTMFSLMWCVVLVYFVSCMFAFAWCLLRVEQEPFANAGDQKLSARSCRSCKMEDKVRASLSKLLWV